HGEQVVGEPVRELREDVGGGGSDEKEIRSVGESHVQDVRVLTPEIRGCGPAREGLEGGGRDEPRWARRRRAGFSCHGGPGSRPCQSPAFISCTIRSPSSVSHGATMSIAVVSLATVSARPPVATTFMSGPSSFR